MENIKNYRKSSQTIECKLFDSNQTVITLLILVVMFFIFLSAAIFIESENLVWAWVSIPTIGLGIIFYTISLLYGPRSLFISGNQLTIVYPQQTIVTYGSELTIIRTLRHRSEGKGKYNGIVVFQDSDGKKRQLQLKFEKPGAKEAFEWFDQLKQSQKEM